MPWGWLRSVWPARKLTHWDVILYTRQGCHLCEQAWEQLEQARRRYGFVLSQVDIDTDPELVREYGTCVPVVRINGRIRFRGVINRVLLQRLFAGGAE
jgi:glutaredoxin